MLPVLQIPPDGNSTTSIVSDVVATAADDVAIAAVSCASSVAMFFDLPMATGLSPVGWCPIKVHAAIAISAIGVTDGDAAAAAVGVVAAAGEVY